MSDTVKVRFKKAFYGPSPSNPDTSIRFETTENLPEGNEGVYEFPADYPLPTRDIEIVSGTPTYKKPSDASPAPVTEIKPSAVTNTGKRTKAASAPAQ